MASSPSGASVPDPDGTSSLAVLYYALEIAAIVFIGLGILPALLTGRVSRTTTWYAFMLSWMWYSITNVLLAGRQSSTEPPFSLCLFQAGLIYASPVFTCATGLAFIIELYLRLGSLKPVQLIVAPLLLNLTVFLEVIIYGLHNRSSVRLNPSGLYCHIATDIQTDFASILVILLIIPTILIEGLTAWTFYRTYRQEVNPANPQASNWPPTLFIRTVFFTFVASIGIAFGSIGLKDPGPALLASQIAAQASVPILCALVFLTQLDILQSWSLRPNRAQSSPVVAKFSSSAV
ncbi:hypothetical protein K438DRAFT_1953500 [Mycena galopus ATCC 62051]|nr:hypothetical protein K438DRAFT_1953500 [Mycena galopus ATCC 62051]